MSDPTTVPGLLYSSKLRLSVLLLELEAGLSRLLLCIFIRVSIKLLIYGL